MVKQQNYSTLDGELAIVPTTLTSQNSTNDPHKCSRVKKMKNVYKTWGRNGLRSKTGLSRWHSSLSLLENHKRGGFYDMWIIYLH